MKQHTFMTKGDIFFNPVTNRPWHDERSQRDHYWKPSLRRCGIRQRRAYQTRHTYATTGLMGGVNPAYLSRQMGHKNSKMFFSVYSKWIDGADRGRERAKLELAQAPTSPALPHDISFIGRRDFYRTVVAKPHVCSLRSILISELPGKLPGLVNRYYGSVEPPHRCWGLPRGHD